MAEATGTADGPFRHAVASGDPESDRVVIWTRVSGAAGPVPVEWVVARDSELQDRVQSGVVQAGPERDWTVHVDVDGLESASIYFYGFRAGDASSPVGRTRTLPSGTPDRLRLAMVSCAKYNAGFFNAYRRIAARSELDFVLHLGDYIYEASQVPPASQTPGADIGRPFDPLHECVTLADYRRRYAHYRSDPDVQALHLAHPLIATMDDHELADGAWRDGSVEHRPERDGSWAERRAKAFRARWEWLPARPPDPSEPERVFRRIAFGNLADLLLIDTRSRRDEPLTGPEPPGADRSQLGAAQRAWLLDAFASSTAAWRILGNASVLSKTWSEHMPERAHRALEVVKLNAPGGGPDPDQWDGYPGEREVVLGHLRHRGIRDVVVLSGDVHVGLALELAPGGSGAPVAVEFVTPSLTSQNVDDKMHWPPRTQSLDVEAAMREALPHLRWVDLDSHGYVTVEVSADRVRADWWAVATVLERTDEERRNATWAVERGRSAVVPG